MPTLLTPPPAPIPTPAILDDATRREFIALLGAAGLLTACGSGSVDSESARETRQVTDALGPVEIPVVPERVAALFFPTLVALAGLGLPVIATEDESIESLRPYAGFLPPNLSLDDIATIGPQSSVDLERLAELRPDLIIGLVATTEEIRAQLTGIAPTVLFEWDGTGSWREHVADIARVLDRPGPLAEIEAEYRAALDEARGALPSSTPAVALIRGDDAGLFRIDLPTSFPGRVLTDAGLTVSDNAGQGEIAGSFAVLSVERLDVLSTADAIVVDDYDSASTLADLSTNPLWAGLPAVAAGRVATVRGEVWLGNNYSAARALLAELPEVLQGLS